jgi:hypothetical protein
MNIYNYFIFFILSILFTSRLVLYCTHSSYGTLQAYRLINKINMNRYHQEG